MFKTCAKYVFSKMIFYAYLFVEIVATLLDLALPLLAGIVVNAIIDGDMRWDTLLALCVFIGIIGVIDALLKLGSSMIYINLQAHSGFQLNADILQHVQKLPQAFFRGFDPAYYNQQINHDSNNLIIFAITSATQLLTNAVLLIVISAILFKINTWFGLVCLLLSFASGFLFLLFRTALFSKTLDMQERQTEFFSALQTQLIDMRFIRQHSLFHLYKERLKRAFDKLYPSVRSSQKTYACFEFGKSTVSAVTQALLLMVGVFEALTGGLRPGYLLTAVSYYSSVSSAVHFFLSWGKSFQEGRVCYERLERILTVPEEQNGTTKISEVSVISCSNLSLQYPGEYDRAFHGLSYQFEKGKIYGIAGANGSGKSSLLLAISGMYPDDITGSILFDNKGIGELDREYLRKYIVGLTEQEPPFLGCSLLANLALLTDGKTDAQKLRKLIHAFDLDDFAGGTVTMEEITDEDQKQGLSGGEKQKVAIIRQLLQNPVVLLFDEPTSALDAKSKKVFAKTLKDERESHITILVTHDEELLSLCDEVLIL